EPGPTDAAGSTDRPGAPPAPAIPYQSMTPPASLTPEPAMVDMPPLPDNPLAPVVPDAGRPQLPKRARQANLAPGLRRRDRDARLAFPEDGFPGDRNEPAAR